MAYRNLVFRQTVCCGKEMAKILSPDPQTWEGDYIAANGSALYDEGRYLYWYQAGEVRG